MSSSSKLPPIEEVGDESIFNCSESHSENEEEEDDVDEEEDLDFNPFLKDSPSLEASSSLSSDIEVLDDDVTGPKPECKTKLVPKKRKSVSISQHEIERDFCERSGTDIESYNVSRELDILEDSEDAISKRTRARYSLASFTLDELETFLQETDDEDDLHNVDDEEEYKKFLTAVLQGGDDDSQIRLDNENVEDEEDEENDADFELELEEALESDQEENCNSDIEKENEFSRRPETRLNRRQKASKTSRVLGNPNRSLRPLLPNTPIANFPKLIPIIAREGASMPVHNNTHGFTPEQLVQLHCLIHEHVQLLIQVFSLTVFDPSKQHIACQVKDLISGAVEKREEVTTRKRSQYPFFLFSPYTHPSVPCGHTQSPNATFVNGSILSVLDVSPLTLVGKYIDEVSLAVHECQRQRIKSGNAAELVKEPLFPFDNSRILPEKVAGVVGGSTEVVPTKKTLAAVIVEKTKKGSIALVPKEIAVLARRFLSMFNPVLFPHKPPPAAVVHRVLFTDSEDELLALGLKEYNSDWKAIQQSYLPCKSKNQIFVRQKNRSSSKAPENPIKAVRKMKTSPLTEEEKLRILEGLKVFKLDWMSVWRYVVPYRDPSLLPRQWRIANGTQKSYKTSDDKKARRRLYEFNRRSKSSAFKGWQTSPEKEECQNINAGEENNSGDDCTGKEDEAYVHEAFLADWRPTTAGPSSSSLPFSYLSQIGSHVKDSHQSNPSIATSDRTWRHGSSLLNPREYKSRKNKNVCVVRLAPDLPPVNLPASVRVISQSAFINNNNTRTDVSVRSSSERSKDSSVPKANSCARDRIQPALQMHPLLFQASGDPYLPYYPLSSGNSSSSSFNFFPPLNPSLCNPHLANQAANHLNKSSKESTSAVGIDFHPLLQRTDEMATDAVTEHRFPQLPVNSDFSRGPLSKSFNVYEKESEVDLDIHLCLSRSEFATGSRDVEQPCEEPFSALFRNRTLNNLDSGERATALSDDGISPSGINAGEQSLPGIVMEQEELSDSEEEFGENVDFECEEMDDSEGDEGSDSQTVKGFSNTQEAAGTASEKQKISDALSLNLSSLPTIISKKAPSSRASRFCRKTSSRNHLKGGTQNVEEIRPILDLLALNPSKATKTRLGRKNMSRSDTGILQKRNMNSNTKSENNAGFDLCQSGKVDINSDRH